MTAVSDKRNMEMVNRKVTVKNPTGLHLRPAGILCNEAMKYQSQITFAYGGGMANAKRVLMNRRHWITWQELLTVDWKNRQ